MADVTITAKFLIRNDTKNNWVSANPVLSKGEMGIEIDTNKFKFGDGATNWNNLKYASSQSAIVKTGAPTAADSGYDLGSVWIDLDTKKAYLLVDNTSAAAVWKYVVSSEDLDGLGNGDMLKSVFAKNSKVADGYVDKAILADTATKLTTGRVITITGDGTGSSTTFDGSENAEISFTLGNTGVTAGTYTKVTVDGKGRVTVGESLAVADIPDLTLAKITDAGTAAGKSVGTAAGDVPVLGQDGKLDTAVLPAIAITEVFEVANEVAMLALDAQTGDVAIRSDINKSFILKTNDASKIENWVELRTPTDTVLSVNGKTGAVTLTTSDIAEGTNQYYTEARATANFNTNIALTEPTDLLNGDKIMLSTDTFIFDGGNA